MSFCNNLDIVWYLCFLLWLLTLAIYDHHLSVKFDDKTFMEYVEKVFVVTLCKRSLQVQVGIVVALYVAGVSAGLYQSTNQCKTPTFIWFPIFYIPTSLVHVFGFICTVICYRKIHRCRNNANMASETS